MGKDKAALEAGVNTMMQIAIKLLGKVKQDGRLCLEEKPDDNAQD
jgi:molybdopterin-guanine dinucleotide biosynthesis protein A